MKEHTNNEKNYSRRHMMKIGLTVLPAIAGCTMNPLSKPPLEKLEIHIADLRPPSYGFTTASMTVIFELSNNSDRKIPSPSAEFDVFINDKPILTSNTSFNTLSPREITKERVNFVFDYTELGDSIIKSMKNRQFTLEIEGEIRSKGATKSTTMTEKYF